MRRRDDDQVKPLDFDHEDGVLDMDDWGSFCPCCGGETVESYREVRSGHCPTFTDVRERCPSCGWVGD